MQQANIDQKLIDKLQKLLALAGSDNEHEAQLAMSKAEDLMREHNLSVADVALNGSGAHVQSQKVYGHTATYAKWEGSLGWTVAKTFNGQAIRISRGKDEGWFFTFVAGRTDLVIIVDLYERLRETIKRMTKQYMAQHKGHQRRSLLQNSYRLGLLNTIVTRLKRFKENTAPDGIQKNAFGLTGKELMVVKERAVEQRVVQLFPDLTMARTRVSRVLLSAYEQGQADGHNVSLHQSVAGGKGGPTALSHR
jgi:hypothetical protein